MIRKLLAEETAVVLRARLWPFYLEWDGKLLQEFEERSDIT